MNCAFQTKIRVQLLGCLLAPEIVPIARNCAVWYARSVQAPLNIPRNFVILGACENPKQNLNKITGVRTRMSIYICYFKNDRNLCVLSSCARVTKQCVFWPPFDTVWRKPWDIFSVFVWYPRFVQIRSVRGSNNRYADYNVGMWWLTWEIVIRRIWQLGYDCRRLSWQRQSGAFYVITNAWSATDETLMSRKSTVSSRQRQWSELGVNGQRCSLCRRSETVSSELKYFAGQLLFIAKW